MKHALLILWLCTIAASAAILTWSSSRAQAAHTTMRMEEASLINTRRQLEQLTSIPETPPTSSSKQTLASRVASVLAASGLPRSSLADLSPQTQQALSKSAAVARDRATLTLASITLPQLGRFLNSWQQTQPLWTVTTLDISPMRQASAVGGDLPLRIVITLETMTVRTPEQKNQP